MLQQKSIILGQGGTDASLLSPIGLLYSTIYCTSTKFHHQFYFTIFTYPKDVTN